MPNVQMPDGTIVAMPERLTPEQATRLRFVNKRESVRGRPGKEALSTPVEQGLAPLYSAGRLVNETVAVPFRSGLAGITANLTGRDADADRARAEAQQRALMPGNEATWAFETRARQGLNKASEAVGRGMMAVDEAVPVPAWAGKAATEANKVLGDIAGVAPVLGSAARFVATAPERAAQKSAASATRTAQRTNERWADLGPESPPMERAKAAGYDISEHAGQEQSGAVKSRLKHFGEAIGINADRDKVIHNIQNTNRLLADDLGLPPGTRFTDATLAQAERRRLDVFDRAERLAGDGPMSSETIQAIRSSVQSTDTRAVLNPATQAYAQKILDEIGEGTVSPQKLRSLMSRIRQDASDNLKIAAGDQPATGARELGEAQRRMAAALEGEWMARLASKGPEGHAMAAEWQNARVDLAKINAIRRAAATSGENPDPGVFGRELAANDAMTGGSRMVADAQQSFPRLVSLTVPQERGLARAAVRLSMAGATKGASETIPFLANKLAKDGTPAAQLGPTGPLAFNYEPPFRTYPYNPPDPDWKGYSKDSIVNRGGAGTSSQETPGLGGAPDFLGRGPVVPRGGREPPTPEALRQQQRAAEALRRAEKLHLEGNMPVPEPRRNLNFNNLTLEGGTPEGVLPQSIDDLVNEPLNFVERTPRTRAAQDPKLRTGGELALPEGRTSGVQAPVNVKWKPNDPAPWVLGLDPKDKAALIKWLRGEK